MSFTIFWFLKYLYYFLVFFEKCKLPKFDWSLFVLFQNMQALTQVGNFMVLHVFHGVIIKYFIWGYFVFSSYYERINLWCCSYICECVGDHARAWVTIDQSLSYNINFSYGWGTKEIHSRIHSRLLYLIPGLSSYGNISVIFYIFLIFVSHSLTNRLAVHIGKSESISCFWYNIFHFIQKWSF